jgi:hypothetical protein
MEESIQPHVMAALPREKQRYPFNWRPSELLSEDERYGKQKTVLACPAFEHRVGARCDIVTILTALTWLPWAEDDDLSNNHYLNLCNKTNKCICMKYALSHIINYQHVSIAFAIINIRVTLQGN